MPLHPSAEAILPMFNELLQITPDSDPAVVRATMEAARIALPEYPLFAVEDRDAPGPGGDVPVRIYRPREATDLGVLVWFHGGGWVLGSIDSHDNLCRQLSDEANVVVVSVGYRLAPEAKFPAALDDSIAAWTWVAKEIASFGGDPARVVIAGDSAGGNLAAAACLVIRDDGLPEPVAQLLVYPVTDYEFESASMRDNAVGYGLESSDMQWFFTHYTSGAEQCADWRVSPLRAPELAGLPPALVITAEYDPLRDQGAAYAQRLADAGVPTEHLPVAGLFHGFFNMHAFIEPARAPWDRAVAMVRAATAAN